MKSQITAVAPASTSRASVPFDVARVRREFPALDQLVRGRRLAYLDNAATTQKPRRVIEAIARYYERDNANVHRGVHQLSERATAAYEGARRKVQRFLGASSPAEIIFVRGATEGVNLVAQSYARTVLREGDAVLVTAMEHHSNIVPWQLVCQQVGARLNVVPMTDEGELQLQDYERALDERTKIVAVTHVSNALGTINPVASMIERAHDRGIPVLVDGAQAVSHLPVDVSELGADFYVLSGHKMFGPTGIGVLYGKAALLDAMPPYQGGGDMIASVTFERSTYNELPYKFEAGTPHISGAIGLGAADRLPRRGRAGSRGRLRTRPARYATARLREIPGLRLIGTARDKAAVLSFVIDGVHPHDIGTIVEPRAWRFAPGTTAASP